MNTIKYAKALKGDDWTTRAEAHLYRLIRVGAAVAVAVKILVIESAHAVEAIRSAVLGK